MSICSDKKILNKIQKFAKKPELVSWSKRSAWEMFCLEGLTKGNILKAIENHVNNEEPVLEEIMSKNKKHKGRKAYVFKPDISGTCRYIKLQFIVLILIKKYTRG